MTTYQETYQKLFHAALSVRPERISEVVEIISAIEAEATDDEEKRAIRDWRRTHIGAW